MWQSLQQEQESHMVGAVLCGGDPQPGARTTQRDGLVSNLPPRPPGKRGDRETSLSSHPNSQGPWIPSPCLPSSTRGASDSLRPYSDAQAPSIPAGASTVPLTEKTHGEGDSTSHPYMPQSANTQKGQVSSRRHTARRVRVQAESWQLLQTAAHPSPSPPHHSPAAFQSPCRGDDRARPARRG